MTYVKELGFGSVVTSGGDHPFLLYDEANGHFVNLCTKGLGAWEACKCGHVAVWTPGNECEIGAFMNIEIRMSRHDDRT